MNSKHLAKNLITHSDTKKDLSLEVKYLKAKIIQEKDKPDTTVTEQLHLLDQLAEFGFGQCLITNRGITAEWTHHMVLYPIWRKQLPEVETELLPLNRWLLEQCSVILATQERFGYFQQLLQDNIQKGMAVASIPCGKMHDLLTLDLSQIPNIKLVGIDLDTAAIEGAKQTAISFKLEKQCSFILADAWQMHIKNEFDIITSNGLNFYEADNAKVIKLYQEFHAALKPKGLFITSFLTPPPTLSKDSCWDMEKINAEDLRLQKVIMAYMLSVRFQAYRTEKQTIEQLKQAGFKDIHIIYDKAKIFPTVWCRA